MPIPSSVSAGDALGTTERSARLEPWIAELKDEDPLARSRRPRPRPSAAPQITRAEDAQTNQRRT